MTARLLCMSHKHSHAHILFWSHVRVYICVLQESITDLTEELAERDATQRENEVRTSLCSQPTTAHALYNWQQH